MRVRLNMKPTLKRSVFCTRPRSAVPARLTYLGRYSKEVSIGGKRSLEVRNEDLSCFSADVRSIQLRAIRRRVLRERQYDDPRFRHTATLLANGKV